MGQRWPAAGQNACGGCAIIPDYPAPKLDIKLAFEEDDSETIAAAKALRLDARFEILRVPAGLPRTKPRACNYALRFARGTHTVVYDAEDRPEPDQLKKAVAAFRASPNHVACFQARLNVYNAGDNWLTRMFALEYAAWFDFLLPGLARLGVPIPLGGTSNHFRTEMLRDAGGWDAFNVTEDADLGVRLARYGLAVIPFDSTTFEEAVPKLPGWIGQRSRWLKGYMQTALVHFRRPRQFVGAIGLARFLGFAAFVGGATATNLLSPVLWLLGLFFALGGSDDYLGPYGAAVSVAAYASLIGGNALLTVLAMAAPFKRGWRHLAPYGASVFVYWLLISAAAYKALWQLATCPFYWEKTEHGLSLSERRPLGDAWRMALVLALAFVLVFAPGGALANAWLKDPGRGEIISSTTVSEQRAGLSGGVSAQGYSGVHIEYGATEDVSIIADGGYQQLSSRGGSSATFDTAVAGGRFVLRRRDYSILSMEVLGGLAGVRESFQANAPMALQGAGAVKFGFGEGFDAFGRHAFASIETGWRWRAGPPADEVLFDVTAGIEPWPTGLLMLQSFSIVGAGAARGAYRRYDLVKFQLSMAQRLGGNWWVQAGALVTAAGPDSGNPGGVLGIWRRF